jgi:undecaprenyl pyrophosphate synthase
MEKTKLAGPLSVPRHVAIIMDGNNRWARKRLLPGVAGHKAGVDAVRAVIEVCAEAKVEVLTLFAFSSENWQRPAEEVGALMELFFTALRRETRRRARRAMTGLSCKSLRTMAVSGISPRPPSVWRVKFRPGICSLKT